MKKNKLKIITIILLILLTTMVSFWGVYGQVQNRMENGVKDYKYAIDLNGVRRISLKLSDEKEEIIKDSEGNVIEDATDEEIEQNGYTKEEKPVNEEDKKTVENYNLVQDILEKRLNKLNVPYYNVRADEDNGEIIVDMPDDDKTDDIISVLTEVGKFEIIDTETKEVLLTNDDIQSSETLRSSTSSGVSIYFAIEFNGAGKKKLEEISKTYVKTEDTTSKDAASEDTTAEENAEETTETEEAETADDNKESSSTEKTVTMKIDGTEIMSTSFDEPLTEGKMYLNVGQATTDTESLNEYLGQARKMVAVLANKNMPLTYEQSGNIYIESSANENITNIIVIAVAAVCVITLIILVVKFKLKGLLATCSYIGAIALLLLIIRYTNVELSTEGVFGIFTILILNFMAVYKILLGLKNTEDVKKAEPKQIINNEIKNITLRLIPLIIMAVVFVFVSWSPTSSFGMVMFYGLIIVVLYNLLITKNLLKDESKK